MKTILFDFDQTLTTRDTLRPFAHYLAGEYQKPFHLVVFYGVLVLFRFRMMGDKRMKELFLNLFLKGKEAGSVQRVVEKYMNIHLKPLLNQKLLEVLVKHCKLGDKVFIVSANFDFFLTPLIQRWRINGIICTQAEKIDGVFTGRMVGHPCKGKMKVERLKAMFSSQELTAMIAFGNADDKDMLQLVGEGNLV